MAFGSRAEGNGGVRNVVQGEPFDFLCARGCCREPFSNFFLRGVPPNTNPTTAMKSFENPASGRAGEARSARRPPSIYFFLVDGTGGGEVIAETRTRIKRLEVYRG